MATALVLFARFPEPGAVKTRLAAATGPAFAAQIYHAFLSDLLPRIRDACDQRVLAYTPDTPKSVAFFRDLTDGDATLWPQPSGSLGERLSAGFDTFLGQFQRVIVIGSDTPTLPPELIAEADESLENSDCVLGPAVDGGYYLVGLRRSCADMFTDIVWDGPNVLEQTVSRVQSAGLSLHVLRPWYDVDTVDDLHALRGHLAAQRVAGDDPGVPCTERLLVSESSLAGDGPESHSVDSTVPQRRRIPPASI